MNLYLPPRKVFLIIGRTLVGVLVGQLISLGRYLLTGDFSILLNAGMSLICGLCTFVATLIDLQDEDNESQEPPNPWLTGFFMLLALAVFWVPILGTVVTWYALYRAKHWNLSSFVVMPVVFAFFVSVAITGVAGLILFMDLTS